jgi:hypothetical protein
MPILEAISNNISALAIGTSVGQPTPGQRAPGGFASTLAAAQSQSNSQPAAGNTVGVLGNSQAKKLPLSGSAVAANNVVAVNTVVPEVLPVPVSQTISAPPLNLSQLILAPSGVSSAISGTVAGTLFGNSAVGQTAVAVGPFTSSASEGSKITNPSELTGVAPNANWKVTSQESASSHNAPAEVTAAPAAIIPNVALLNPSPDIQWSRGHY